MVSLVWVVGVIDGVTGAGGRFVFSRIGGRSGCGERAVLGNSPENNVPCAVTPCFSESQVLPCRGSDEGVKIFSTIMAAVRMRKRQEKRGFFAPDGGWLPSPDRLLPPRGMVVAGNDPGAGRFFFVSPELVENRMF